MKLLTMAILASAVCGSAWADEGKGPMNESQEKTQQAVAYAAVIAQTSATNCMAISAALSPAAARKWQAQQDMLLLEGKQYFLPDFFKAATVFSGGVSGDAFCFGLYNPFHDRMWLASVKGFDKPQIVDFRWVSGASLRSEQKPLALPTANGVNPPSDYFIVMLKSVGDAMKGFTKRFGGASFAAELAALPDLTAAEAAGMVDVMKLRLAQIVQMQRNKRGTGTLLLGAQVLRNGAGKLGANMAGEKETQATLKAVGGMPSALRQQFQPIAYFEVGQESCVVFNSPALPTLLVMARCSDGKTMRFGMFDLRIANDWEKKAGI